MANSQQPIPVNALFARVRGIPSFRPRYILSAMYEGPIALRRAMATQKQPQQM